MTDDDFDPDFDLDLDEEDPDAPVAGLVTGICRRCEAQITDVTVEEGERWERKHRRTCPRRDQPAIW
ncbi:hypothetical protein ACFQ05_04355 [Amycolatopsis umgeniensis]|uniref:Uncharacterized protein n=1 Tax=Amycolatopsis umgeniensis TaxID=336628 RepID=A0A841B2B5_9PSEU|nr:hypothetical protein [Amycolatopsis umgeniensis]MBB5852498.1 hypothetical protein [Amycolatopsis umgeniensis]